MVTPYRGMERWVNYDEDTRVPALEWFIAWNIGVACGILLSLVI